MKEKTRKLLEELSQELRRGGELDPEARELLRRIHDDIDEGPTEHALEKAKELEARFAARYPVAERITRMILDSLGKMGI